MGFMRSLGFRSGMLSVLILLVVLAIWHVATLAPAPVAAPVQQLTAEQIEYARLMGKDPATLAAPAASPARSGFPTLAQMGEVVVKNLESNYRKVNDVSGATIMGDGRVALILDIGSLVRKSRH